MKKNIRFWNVSARVDDVLTSSRGRRRRGTRKKLRLDRFAREFGVRRELRNTRNICCCGRRGRWTRVAERRRRTWPYILLTLIFRRSSWSYAYGGGGGWGQTDCVCMTHPHSNTSVGRGTRLPSHRHITHVTGLLNGQIFYALCFRTSARNGPTALTATFVRYNSLVFPSRRTAKWRKNDGRGHGHGEKIACARDRSSAICVNYNTIHVAAVRKSPRNVRAHTCRSRPTYWPAPLRCLRFRVVINDLYSAYLPDSILRTTRTTTPPPRVATINIHLCAGDGERGGLEWEKNNL